MFRRRIDMLIIGRFEGDFAVCESGESRAEIPRALLPQDAKEGDVLIYENQTYRVDAQTTAQRRREVLERLRKWS